MIHRLAINSLTVNSLTNQVADKLTQLNSLTVNLLTRQLADSRFTGHSNE